MPVTIDCMGHRYRVIHVHFVDHWDWSEFFQALIKAHTLMEKTNYQITIVFDFLGSVKASPKLLTVTERRSFPLSQRLRFVIIMDEPLLARDIIHSLRSLYPHAEEILAVGCYEELSSSVRSSSVMTH